MGRQPQAEESQTVRGPGESVTMYVCCPCWQDMQRETPCMCFWGWHGVGVLHSFTD